MSDYQIVIDQWRGRSAAALLKSGVLDDLIVAPDDQTPVIGAIYRAVVDRPMKGLGGAIMKLGQGQSGFLRQAKGLRAGETLLVQVTGIAEPGKAAPVTPRVLFKSRFAIVTPHAPGVNISRQIRDDDDRERIAEVAHSVTLEEGHGAILRSSAVEADAETLADDLASTAELASNVMSDSSGAPELLVDGPDPAELAWRDWPKPSEVFHEEGAFEQLGVVDLVENEMQPHVPLENGAFMFVEPTRALTAVDINTGGDTSPAAGLKANISAARALPRALRLRGLSGQVVLDLAPMPKKDRVRWEQVLKSALRGDPIETSMAGWTPLGHVELQRKRERVALHEVRS